MKIIRFRNVDGLTEALDGKVLILTPNVMLCNPAIKITATDGKE